MKRNDKMIKSKKKKVIKFFYYYYLKKVKIKITDFTQDMV